jgi:uncharacterized protein YqgC (DUF456 family)
MQRTTRSAAGAADIALFFLLLIGGIGAIGYLPGFGFVVGPVLCVFSVVYIAARRQRVWRCERCGEYFDPTVSSSNTRRR